MELVTKKKAYIILVAYILLSVCTSPVSAAVKNGFLSKKLDEYYSTIKCVANILEDLMIPEYNTLIVCCGVWIINDWFGGLVQNNCYHHNYYQLNNLTEPFLQQMEENCGDYPKDSFTCKLVIITPITILVLIFLLIISLTACVIFTCIRLRYYQKYYESQNSQEFDSTEESSDDASTPSMKKRKSLDA